LVQAQAENEAYLQQIEAEGRVESVYGPGVQLVVPQPGFVIKTKDAVGRKRVYINICTSDKVQFRVPAATNSSHTAWQVIVSQSTESILAQVVTVLCSTLVDACFGCCYQVGKMELKTGSDSSNKQGSRPQVLLPMMLRSQPQDGAAVDGGQVVVWDLVVHPEAIITANDNPEIRHMLVTMVRQATAAARVVGRQLLATRIPHSWTVLAGCLVRWHNSSWCICSVLLQCWLPPWLSCGYDSQVDKTSCFVAPQAIERVEEASCKLLRLYKLPHMTYKSLDGGCG
jgi:hypothetical protein